MSKKHPKQPQAINPHSKLTSNPTTNMSTNKNTVPSQDATSQARKETLPLTLTEQVGKKATLDKVLEHYNAWLPRYQEFAQGRSNFQIEKMIATEHVTPAASYQHTLYQLRVLHHSLINDFVRGIEQQREFEYKWTEADQSKPQWWDEGKEKKLCWYDTDLIRHQHEIEELKMSVKDKLLQLETFTKVLRSMEEKHQGAFTQAELNDEEPEYWKLRFARQMADEYLDKQTGLGTGNLKSLRMAVADSPIPDSKNKVEDFPDLLNAVLSGRENGLEALNALNEELFGHINGLGATAAPKLAKTAPPKAVTSETEAQKAGVSQAGAAAAADAAAELNRLKQAGITISELED